MYQIFSVDLFVLRVLSCLLLFMSHAKLHICIPGFTAATSTQIYHNTAYIYVETCTTVVLKFSIQNNHQGL